MAVIHFAFSLLQIAAKVAGKLSTILAWIRELKKLNGFFTRDARGIGTREKGLCLMRIFRCGFVGVAQEKGARQTVKYVNQVQFSNEGGMLKLETGRYNLTNAHRAMMDPRADDPVGVQVRATQPVTLHGRPRERDLTWSTAVRRTSNRNEWLLSDSRTAAGL